MPTPSTSPSTVSVEEVGGPAPADAGPNLETAPNLLYNLGLCIAISSTREVSQVDLPHPAPGGPALSTNLILIAQEGSDAFLGAYGDLLEMSSAAEELCETSGLLDQLALVLMNGTKKKKSENMIVGWVQARVDKSVKSGETIAGNLNNWKATVKTLRLALTSAHVMTTRKIDRIADAAADMTVLQGNNQDEIAATKQGIKASEILVTSNLDTYTRRRGEHETLLKAQMADYVRNPFYAAISRPIKWIARNEHGTATALRETTVLRLDAEKDVTQAQQELDRYRREQKALNVQARRIQADLEAFSVKKVQLEKVFATIELVCGLIDGLTQDIETLLTNFKRLSKEIGQLTAIRNDFVQTKRGGFKLGSKVFNPFNRKDTSSLIPIGAGDEVPMKAMYLGRIQRMKRVCISIHVLSSMYANAIQTVIKEGFSAAAQCSWNRMGQTSDDTIFDMRKKMMQQWRATATKTCARMTHDAAHTMQSRIEASDREQMAPPMTPSTPSTPMPFPTPNTAASTPVPWTMPTMPPMPEMGAGSQSGRVFARSPTTGRAYEVFEVGGSQR